MIQLRDVTLRYGERLLFDSITCTFNNHQHIGVVGRNGAGKSTLLKALAGQIVLDEGSISVSRGKKIAYMPQELVLLSDKSIFDEAYSVFSDMVVAFEEQQAIGQKLESSEGTEEMIERYAVLQEKLADYDPSQCKAQVERILKGLGFATDSFGQPVAELSVGWKMRIVLAKLLLQKADFYLFDEPTNHLDIVSKEWFFNFLKYSQCGFLLVSHDRHYLERACTMIFEIEQGRGHLYNGNFSSYIQQKEQASAVKEAAYERQQKEIKQKQATIDRFRASATKAKMAQSMIKQLEKIELIEPDPVLPSVKFSFRPVVRAGHIVLTFTNLVKSFNGRTIFKNISGYVERGEKIAVIAPNGAGKTTLFSIIANMLQNDAGSVEFGHNVTSALFEQDQLRALNPRNTILEEVSAACPTSTEATVRSFLGSFLFSGDDVHKKISMLSGGERSRVAMVKVLLERANFLLLDEPTNHLDLYSKEVLLQALQQYDGTILMVCHDHDFIERLATRILELTPAMLHSYMGSYESYLAQKEHQESMGDRSPASETTKAQKNNSPGTHVDEQEPKDSCALKKELSSLEGKIKRLEAKVEQLGLEFADHEYGSTSYQQLFNQHKVSQQQLEQALKRWEELAGTFD